MDQNLAGRCGWAGSDPLYIDYHDNEWGVPERDSRALWEKLVLEGFQSGLSWITILKKRENFRQAFHGFDPNVVARWGEKDAETLLGNAGIVRHRGKIEAAISNAKVFLDIEEKEGFSAFLWDFVDGLPVQNRWERSGDVPAVTPVSEALSKALRYRGFRFVGPTTVYAAMQAMGLVNDHLVTCPRHAACAAMA
jgi:DNA-3-methyladenine glycosylase I